MGLLLHRRKSATVIREQPLTGVGARHGRAVVCELLAGVGASACVPWSSARKHAATGWAPPGGTALLDNVPVPTNKTQPNSSRSFLRFSMNCAFGCYRDRLAILWSRGGQD